MAYFIAKENDGKLQLSSCKMLDNPSLFRIIDNPQRIKIFEAMADKPMYPAEIAKKLKMHEQKVYYHIKQMLNTGLIEVTEKKEVRGTIAKKFRPKSLNFAIAMGKEWEDFEPSKQLLDKKLADFLSPFVHDGKLDAYIVVGSPDPHGPFQSNARDNHLAIDLALFLGKFCNIEKKSMVKLDIEIKKEKEEKNNLILIGGSGTNVITYEINNFLPVKFDITPSEKGFFCSGLISEKTGRKINDPTSGIICRITNPYDPKSKILLISGYRFAGIRSAILALTSFNKQILQKFNGQEEFAVVVRGLDIKGDGVIDSIEIIE